MALSGLLLFNLEDADCLNQSFLSRLALIWKILGCKSGSLWCPPQLDRRVCTPVASPFKPTGLIHPWRELASRRALLSCLLKRKNKPCWVPATGDEDKLRKDVFGPVSLLWGTSDLSFLCKPTPNNSKFCWLAIFFWAPPVGGAVLVTLLSLPLHVRGL